MTKQKILLLKGLPGSGKTTKALQICEENPNFRRVNKDSIREELGNPSWSREFEKQVLNTAHYRAEYFLDEGFSVIIDDTNFAPKHSQYYQTLAKNRGIEFEELFIDTPLEECINRDSSREKPVGEAIIRKMYKDYLKPDGIKKDTRLITEQDWGLPKCVIFDIDGTLALINGRSPYDDSKIHTDLPNSPVIDILDRYSFLYNNDHFYSNRNKIILMSGRMDKCREQTEKWLEDNDIYPDLLYMRKTDDYRQDSIVKKELYEEFIKDKYYVEAWFDDRDQVVKMIREELGLLCCQVYYGNF